MFFNATLCEIFGYFVKEKKQANSKMRLVELLPKANVQYRPKHS